MKKVDGFNYIPRTGPAIIAFNHQSFLDFVCFVAVAPRNVYYLTAEKFYTHPFWKPVMEWTGQIKVERTSKEKGAVHNAVQEKLSQGKLIGIFPEGTRAPELGTMLPGYCGVSRYALHENVPVIPIGIIDADVLWSRHESKPSIKRKMQFVAGEGIYPEKYKKLYVDPIDQETEMTKEIMQKLSTLSGRVYGGVHAK